jgi:hypothetical protein
MLRTPRNWRQLSKRILSAKHTTPVVSVSVLFQVSGRCITEQRQAPTWLLAADNKPVRPSESGASCRMDYCKVKVKVHPITGPEDPRGGVEV